MTDETRRRRPSFDIVLVALILALLGGYLALAKERARRKNSHKDCAENLGRIAMAAFQYADDKRFLPHMTRIPELDGDHTTDTAAQAMNLLVKYGYQTDPRVFVCPASRDRIPERAPEKIALTASVDLSYGWTRRGLTTNGGLNLLAGDKSRFVPEEDGWHTGNMRGNHTDCMMAVFTDGHVTRIRPEGDGITTKNVASTRVGGGYLGVLAD
jgi:hypothetical protein